MIGLTDVPSAGDPVHVVKDPKKAQEIAEGRKTKERSALGPSTGARAMTLEDLAKAMAENEQLELKLIIKADVQGSVEAVSDALIRLSTEKVKVSVVHAAAGAITEGDVNLAVAAGAIIIGFNVRPAGKAAALAQKENIQIRQYNIIYNVVDEVKAAMEGLLAPTLVEKVIGRAEIRQIFRVSKSGNVAGCMVTEGVVRRNSSIRAGPRQRRDLDRQARDPEALQGRCPRGQGRLRLRYGLRGLPRRQRGRHRRGLRARGSPPDALTSRSRASSRNACSWVSPASCCPSLEPAL